LKLKKWISRILASKENSGFMGCIKEVFHCIPIIFTNKEKKQIVNCGTRRLKIADDKYGTKYRKISVITPSSALSLIILY
jgi:hypothetical protein